MYKVYGVTAFLHREDRHNPLSSGPNPYPNPNANPNYHREDRHLILSPQAPTLTLTQPLITIVRTDMILLPQAQTLTLTLVLTLTPYHHCKDRHSPLSSGPNPNRNPNPKSKGLTNKKAKANSLGSHNGDS